MAITGPVVGVVLAPTGNNPASIAPAFPTTAPTASRKYLSIAYVAMKPDTGSIATPAGWSLLGTISGGAGTTGVDTGPVEISVFTRDDLTTGPNSGTVTFTLTSASVAWAYIERYECATTEAFFVEMTSGADTTAGAAYSAVTASVATGFIQTGDSVSVVTAIPTDTLPTTWGTPTLTAQGAGSGTIATGTLGQRAAPATAGGNDLGGRGVTFVPTVTGTVNAGTLTWAFTATGTTTNLSGPTAIVRIRAGTPVVNAAVALTATSTLNASPPPALPGLIDGIEPESHGYVVPIMDSNGNLYRITEATLANNNQPQAMKSTDGGITWVEMDNANSPGADTGSIGDLESGWTTWNSATKMITFTWQRSYVVWSGFRTSDHPTNPDTWVSNTRENIAALTGSPQYASHTTPTDQAYEWIFYNNSTTKPSYRSRTSSGVYGTQADVDSTGQCPAAILDPLTNISHILYAKAGHVHYKKLTSAGTLDAASTQVDVNGVSLAVPISYAAPQVYTNGGTTYVSALFVNTSAQLIHVRITNGVVGGEEIVTSSAVMLDPDITTNQAAVISLAVDGTTLHAIWSDSATGNVMHSERPLAGSWTAPDTMVTLPGTDQAQWVYGKVYTYPGSGQKVLGYTYDIGPHGDDDSNIWYNERALTAAPTTVSGAAALSAVSTLNAAASLGRAASAALMATSTLTTAGTRTTSAPVALTASSTLTTAAARVLPASVALSATSSLSVVAGTARGGAAALTASSTLVTTSQVPGGSQVIDFNSGFPANIRTSGGLGVPTGSTDVSGLRFGGGVNIHDNRLSSDGSGEWWLIDDPAWVGGVGFDFGYDLEINPYGGSGRDIANFAFWISATDTSDTTTWNGLMLRMQTDAGDGGFYSVVGDTHGYITGQSWTGGGNVVAMNHGVPVRVRVWHVPADDKVYATVTRLIDSVVLDSGTLDLSTISETQTGYFGQKKDSAQTVTGHRWDNLTLVGAPATATVTRTAVAQVAMAATGTLTPAASLTRTVAVAFSAASTLTPGGVRERPAVVALSAAAVLTPGGVRARPAAVAMTAVGTLGAQPTGGQALAAALSAASTLTMAVVQGRVAAVALSSMSTLSSSGVRAAVSAVALTVAATMNIAGVRTAQAAVAFLAVHSMDVLADSTGQKSGAVDLVATSSLLVGAVRARDVVVTLTAVQTTSVSSVTTRNAMVALVVTSTLTPGVVRVQPGQVAMVSTATLEALPATSARQAAVALVAAALLSTAAYRDRPAPIAFTSVSTLLAAAVAMRVADSVLTAAATLTAGPTRTRPVEASLTSVATLLVYATVIGQADISDLVWAVMRPNTTRAMIRENGEASMRPNWTRALMQETS